MAVVVSYLFMVSCRRSCRCARERRILDNLTRFAQFLFGHLVALRHAQHDDLRPALVRRLLPRGALSEWASRRSWSLGGRCHAAEMGWLAVRRVRHHHHLWPAGQRL